MTDVAAAIFLGGGSTRMGGRPKGRLRPHGRGESILEHLLSTSEAAELFPCYLVGDAAPYQDLLAGRAVLHVADDPPGVGPIGGLRALMSVASGPVVVVACDMPHVAAAAMTELRAAILAHPRAAAVTARAPESTHYEPMLTAYRPDLVKPALDEMVSARRHGLQRLFMHSALAGDVVTIHSAELTRARADWDTPDDVDAGGGADWG